jgi:hypothetical protein
MRAVGQRDEDRVTDPTIKCPKCAAAMEKGYIADLAEGVVLQVASDGIVRKTSQSSRFVANRAGTLNPMRRVLEEQIFRGPGGSWGGALSNPRLDRSRGGGFAGAGGELNP